MAESKINEMIQTSLESIKKVIDANTIIGDPIHTPDGTFILPISKVAVGYASGGVDYNSKIEKPRNDKNFGGGGGTGITVSPVGFLVIKTDGSVELLNINHPVNDFGASVNSLVDKLPGVMGKIKNMFSKKKETTGSVNTVFSDDKNISFEEEIKKTEKISEE